MTCFCDDRADAVIVEVHDVECSSERVRDRPVAACTQGRVDTPHSRLFDGRVHAMGGSGHGAEREDDADHTAERQDHAGEICESRS
jgi:hypothetical protein